MPKDGDLVTEKLPNGGTITYEYHAPVKIAPSIALKNAVDEAKIAIDAAASVARARHVTQGILQQQIYDMKAAEAQSYIAANYPKVTTGYPLLTEEALAIGKTVAALADSIVATKNAWLVMAGKIEGARINGKQGVSNAADVNAVETAKSDALLALSQL